MRLNAEFMTRVHCQKTWRVVRRELMPLGDDLVMSRCRHIDLMIVKVYCDHIPTRGRIRNETDFDVA